jgi:hypothetical protein
MWLIRDKGVASKELSNVLDVKQISAVYLFNSIMCEDKKIFLF